MDAKPQPADAADAAGAFEPRYVWLARHLTAEIRSGRLPPGARLPSENELARDHRVSRATAIAALEELARSHLAHRVRGRGTFVSKPAISRFSLAVGFSEDMRRRGLVPGSRDVILDRAAPDAETMERLDAPAEECWRLTRVRLADAEPMALQVSYLPPELYPGLERHDLSRASLFELMHSTYRLGPHWAEAIVEARLPTSREARLMHITTRQPVLLVWHLSLDAELQPLEYVRSLYRSDRFSFASGRQPMGDT